MQRIGILCIGLVAIVQGLLQKEKGLNDWSLTNLGDLKYLHYYYEGSTLKGLFAATHEGTLALINPKTGALYWRKTLLNKRSIDKAVFENERIVYKPY